MAKPKRTYEVVFVPDVVVGEDVVNYAIYKVERLDYSFEPLATLVCLARDRRLADKIKQYLVEVGEC